MSIFLYRPNKNEHVTGDRFPSDLMTSKSQVCVAVQASSSVRAKSALVKKIHEIFKVLNFRASYFYVFINND